MNFSNRNIACLNLIKLLIKMEWIRMVVKSEDGRELRSFRFKDEDQR